MEHDVQIKMIADVEDLKRQVAGITKDMSGLEKQIGRTGKATTFSAVSQGLQMVERYGKQVIAVMKDLVATFAEASRESTTWNIMMEHSKFSQEEIDSLKEYSSELQNYTGISDEAISNTERLLLSATDLTKDGLIRATNACADLSKAMGTDITASAQTLSIALASPAEGLTRLRRSGILFTDAEEDMIKKLEEGGDTLKAQELMLSKIEERYGGIAKAIGDTPIGTLDKIKETWGDIKEGLGGALLDSISPALDQLYVQLDKIKRWIDEQNETRKDEKTQIELSQKINNATKYGLGYGDFTDDELRKEAEKGSALLERATKWLENKEISKGIWQTYYDTYVEYTRPLMDELERRAKTPAYMLEQYVGTLSESGVLTNATKELLNTLFPDATSTKEAVQSFFDMVGVELEEGENPLLHYFNKDVAEKMREDIASMASGVDDLPEEMKKAEEEYNALLQAVKDYNSYAEYYKDKGDDALATYWSNKAKAVQEQIDNLYKIIDESTEYDDADEATQGDESGRHNRFSAWAEELDKLTGSEKINALINFREEIGKVLASLSGEDKDDAVRALEEINDSLTTMVDNVLGYALPVVSSFGEALGETLAGGEDAWKGFGKTAINSIAQVIEALGQEAIATATKNLIASKFLDATAWAGLAKGAGIVALAGTVRGLARFERGGIVGGTGITGDSRLIRANAGELILTRAQQNSIANQLQSGGKTTQINVSFNGTVLGDQQSVSAWVYDGIERAKYNGVI